MKRLLSSLLFGGALLSACSPEPKVEALSNDITEGAANVLFIFDDGWSTQYTEGYRILDAHGLKGSIGVVTNAVGNTNYMDEDQLDEVYDRGWDLVNHTKSHPYLNELTAEKQSEEILGAQEWMTEKGYTRASDAFIYPYGAFNETTVDILADNGYRFARDVHDGYVSGLTLEARTMNVRTATKPAEVIKRIDAAIQSGSTLALMFHKIGDEVDDHDMYYRADWLEEVAKYAAERKADGTLNVLTVSEYIDIASKPYKGEVLNGKWLTPVNSGHPYNGELQHYVEDNVTIKDGVIAMKGKRESYKDHDYTSGKVTTKDRLEFRYGKVAFHARTNFEVGSFPAVWLLPADDVSYLPEIDAFEAVGSAPGYAYYVNHYMEGDQMKKSARGYKLPTNPTGYHYYVMEWSKDSIKWYVDGRLIHVSTEGVPQVPMYLIVNLAVGGVWSGPPNETSFPMKFEVKDLRVITEEVTK